MSASSKPTSNQPGSTGKPRAVFTQGSTMRHVIVMTAAASIGLMSIFLVDAVTLFYVSQLGDPAQTAAVGRASYVIGFLIAISVGMMIGASVVVARAIGAGQEDKAWRSSGSALVGTFVVSVAVTALGFLLKDWFLARLDATGAALDYANLYLNIILPGLPLMAVGMVSMGLLRAKGDAKRSMYVTLMGGILTAILDPIFIFGLGLEITGAAIVSLIVRASFAGLGLYFVVVVHRMVRVPNISLIVKDVREIAQYAVPAIFTNLAAPVGAFLIAQKISEYGDAAIAGQAVADRLMPLAFGVIFALSGAVGPIIGQNAGAGLLGRARQTLIDGMVFNFIYVLVAWGLLFLARNAVIDAFAARGDAALMIDLFCSVIAASFLFNGTLFVTNAAFNNLGKPLWATFFNWSRQTFGVLPFIYVGAQVGGLRGLAFGIVAGSVPFALLAAYSAFRLVNRVEKNALASSETAASSESAASSPPTVAE